VRDSDEDKFVGLAVTTMVFSSGSTGWLVCEQCSSRFTFDRDEARQCAKSGRQPRGSGRPHTADVVTAAKCAWQKLKRWKCWKSIRRVTGGETKDAGWRLRADVCCRHV